MTNKTSKFLSSISAVVAGGLMAMVVLPTFANSQNTYYTVKKGDTLSAIARSYGTTVDNIVAANNIPNKNLIYVNQVIVIPTGGSSSSGSSGTVNYYQYQVVKGDNLYRIAIKYNTTVAQLAAWNGIQNTSLIYVGDILQVMPVDTQYGTQTESTGTTYVESTQTAAPVAPDTTTSDTTASDTTTEGTVTEEEYLEAVFPEVEKDDNFYEHIVAEECTVFVIADLYQVKAMDIITWNVIDDPMALPVGSVILIEKQEYSQEVLAAYLGEDPVLELADEYFVVEYEEALDYEEYQLRTGEICLTQATTTDISTFVNFQISPDQEEFYVESPCSVFDVAELFQVDAMDLIRWNVIEDPMELAVGTILRVVGE